MNKKNEQNLALAGTIAFGVCNLISMYLGLGVLVMFFLLTVTYGSLGLYFKRKDIKEEKEREGKLPDKP